MFGYTVSRRPDEAAFERTCNLIERLLPDVEKNPVLNDVDGSKTQIYRHDGRKIRVDNDYEVGCVSVDSEIELDIPHIGEYDPSEIK